MKPLRKILIEGEVLPFDPKKKKIGQKLPVRKGEVAQFVKNETHAEKVKRFLKALEDKKIEENVYKWMHDNPGKTILGTFGTTAGAAMAAKGAAVGGIGAGALGAGLGAAAGLAVGSRIDKLIKVYRKYKKAKMERMTKNG